MDCNNEWRPPDIRQPGYCENCGSVEYEYVRCSPCEGMPEGCYMKKLEDSLDSSPDAYLLSAVREIEVQLNLRLTVLASDVPADVYIALLIVNEERTKYDKEHQN